MKKLIASAALAIIATVQAPTAGAQIETQLTMTSWNVYTNNGGGGWNATSTVGLGSNNLTSLVVYCFDDTRHFGFNSTYNYLALTFDQFLNSTGAGGTNGRATNWNTVNLKDLNTIASIIGTYAPALQDGTTVANNSAKQSNIWNIGNDVTPGDYAGPADVFKSGWMVLVDRDEWRRGLDGQQGFQGSQSFLVQVPNGSIVTPEPSSYALMTAGLAVVGVVSRRRRA